MLTKDTSVAFLSSSREGQYIVLLSGIAEILPNFSFNSSFSSTLDINL